MMRYFLIVLFSLVLSVSLLQGQGRLVEGKILKKDSLLMDLQLLQQALTEIHPGIYRYQTPESVEQLFSQLGASLDEEISEAQFLKRLSQTTAQIRCGHTYANPWNMKKAIRERLFGGAIYLPLGFQVIDGTFVVTHNASNEKEIQRGAQIKMINGVPVAEIIDSLATLVKRDGHNDTPIPSYISLDNFKARNWAYFDLYFPIFFPLQEPYFRIQYQNYGDKEMKEAQIAAMTKKERETKMVEHYGAEVLTTEDWSFQLLNSDLAVIRLGTFAIWNWKDFDYKKWFADTFHQLDSLAIPNLIVDIRANGGGLGDPRDELLSYLIQKPLKCDQTKILIRTTKVNPNLVPYCDTWVKPILEGLPAEYYTEFNEEFLELKEDSGCRTIEPQAKAYKGKTFIFGGASNVSATFTMLQKAKKEGFATFVGETSGGNQQGINGGEYIFFRMPYSGMEVDIPLKFFATQGNPSDGGIRPAVEIKLTQKAIAEHRDPSLDYVLKQIKH